MLKVFLEYFGINKKLIRMESFYKVVNYGKTWLKMKWTEKSFKVVANLAQRIVIKDSKGFDKTCEICFLWDQP